jgi:anti-sigma B factor antagonist
VHPGEIGLERQNSGVVVVSLTGEHDLTTAPALRERIEGVAAEGTGLLIDLSAAEFIDSSIIGVILEAQRQADEAGTGFAAALEGGDAAVRRVLEVTGLDTNMPVHTSMDQALAHARTPKETKALE